MPIDRTLFPRLKRLFNTDSVIRSTGAGQLKVVDTEHIQSFGQLQTNTLADRFTRIHKAGIRMQFNPTLNYQTLRLQLYNDYESMDSDGIVSAALDILAAESTIKGETNEILRIRSSDENIQAVLYNLFYDVLNIEFNLQMWIRSMCKYGDFFLKLEIAEKYGVYSCKPLSAYDISREEGQDPDNPAYIRFVYNPTAIAGGTSAATSKQFFENFEIAHFRLLTDTLYLPLGRSYLEPARKYYKQYILMLDASLLHRIMKSAEKRVFFINVGNLPPNDVDAYMEKVKNTMKKTPYQNPQTGDYNLKFNVMNAIEDFYIPQRPGDNTTRIETTKGLDFAGMEDVAFLRDLMLGALKVPKAFMNYSDELAGKSTISALDLIFSRLIEFIQRVVISELKKIAMIHLYVQGYTDADLVNFELSLNNPSIIYEQEKIALLKEKIALVKDAQETNLFSSDYMYDKIFEMSEDEWNTERALVVEDNIRKFRYSQIENEGNDPQESGQSYGTPHDLATIYKKNSDGDMDVPDGYNEYENIPGPNGKTKADELPVGRPKVKASVYSTDKSYTGRDPIGKKGMKDFDEDDGVKFKNKPKGLALENTDTKTGKKLVELQHPVKKSILTGLDKKGFSPKKIALLEEQKPTGGLLSDENIPSEE